MKYCPSCRKVHANTCKYGCMYVPTAGDGVHKGSIRLALPSTSFEGIGKAEENRRPATKCGTTRVRGNQKD